jgi:hypothetical protein
VFLIVAHRHDEAARRLVAQWTADEAALLTCDDLATPGWRVQFPDDEQTTAMVAGRPVHARDISGVLTRWPRFTQTQFPHIAARDREFVAQETTAFVTAFLTGLDCPVLNRPRPSSLCGREWSRAQWTAAAGRLGFPVTPLRQRASVESGAPESPPFMATGQAVTVIGEACLGGAHAELERRTQLLARAAGVESMVAFFDGDGPGARFLSASVMPALDDAEALAALQHYFAGHARRRRR